MLSSWYLGEVGSIILIFIHEQAKAQTEPEWQKWSRILFHATYSLHADVSNEDVSLEGQL